MTHAKEIRNILHENIQKNIQSGEKKAFQALEVIDACILNAAKECNVKTDVYILRIINFDNDNEKQAYIFTLRRELEKNDYKVSFSPTSGIMHISWGL